MFVLLLGLFSSAIFMYREVTLFPESGKTGPPCCWGSWVNLDEEIRLSKNEGRASKWIALLVCMAYLLRNLEYFIVLQMWNVLVNSWMSFYISVIEIFEGGSADDFHGDVNVRKDGPVDGLTTCRFHRKFLMEKLDLETSFFLFVYLFLHFVYYW